MLQRHVYAPINCDVAQEMYVRRDPAVLAGVVADPAVWRSWWPDLQLEPTRDRGVEGRYWTVSGPVSGEMEIWLEPGAAGTLVHWFVRAQAAPGCGPRAARRWQRRAVRVWRAQLFAVKDRLEAVKSSP